MAEYDFIKNDIAKIDQFNIGDIVSNIVRGLIVKITSERLGDGAYGGGTYEVRVIKSKKTGFRVNQNLVWDASLEGRESFF